MMIAQEKIKLVKAELADYPIIQNMARFYVYDMSRYCGHDSNDWACPEDGLYESIDFKSYFIEKDRQAYYIKVDNELAGFVLINKDGLTDDVDWSMGEFFVLARFQGRGVAKLVVKKIWDQLNGVWEVRVIPENIKTLKFWRAVVKDYSLDHFIEELKAVDNDEKRYVLKFLSNVENIK